MWITMIALPSVTLNVILNSSDKNELSEMILSSNISSLIPKLIDQMKDTLECDLIAYTDANITTTMHIITRQENGYEIMMLLSKLKVRENFELNVL